MAQLINCWTGKFHAGDGERIASLDNDLNFLPGFDSFTIQAWARKSSSTASNTLFARGLAANIQYSVSYEAGSTIDVYVGGTKYDFDPQTSLGINIDDFAWHHVVLAVNTSVVRLYVDGQQCGTDQAISGTSVAPAVFVVGAQNDTASSNYTNYFADAADGYIDEVAVWNKLLSASEILALYNGGSGLSLDDNSGSYVSSDELQLWWRMGDGTTENPGGVPSVIVSDMSGNEHIGRYNATAGSGGIVDFYQTEPWVGPGSCPDYGSSSSLAATPEIRLDRADQGVLESRTGFEGDLHRMVVTANANVDYLDENIFVYEMSRVMIGSPIRRPVFRRVATLHDMTHLTTSPQTKFPHAYRTRTAEVLGETTVKLDTSWREIQYQMAKLTLDIVEFGLAANTGGRSDTGLRGAGSATITDQEVFALPAPPAEADEPTSSSSSAVVAEAAQSSSQQQSTVEQMSSSSSVFVLTSSSSLWVDPYAFSETIMLDSARTDSAARLTEDGVKTLFNDLGFVRFGRDSNPLRTWDTFLRFPVSIPSCAFIESCYLSMSRHTTEYGEDVVLKIFDIYDDASFTPISPFTSENDPPKANRYAVWDRVSALFSAIISVDISNLLQFFVDRENYTPGDYFGLWIKEVQSDPGARRDVTLPPSKDLSLVVNYRTDRLCSSSWIA